MSEWDDFIEEPLKDALKNRPEEYEKRAKKELKFIHTQGYEDYWVDLVKQGKKFEENKNGLVIAYLLGITDVDPVENGIDHIYNRQSDFPDIDIDFLPISRDPLKKYISDKYGSNKVCSVGNWITYKPKSALQDVCRAYGEDFREVMQVTKDLPDEFDLMSMEDISKIRNGEVDDADREYERYKAFFDYWDVNPKIVEMAFKISGMIRAHGTHAGGVIISNYNLHDLIPLAFKNDVYSSQWTEGKNTQLSKFGLIKFDLLGLKTMYYIWQACNFIRENRGIEFDWSDMDPVKKTLGYEIYHNGSRVPIMMDDELSMNMINSLQTESIFQHETPIQKGIIDDGKVKDFWDMVAYSSLGRPGPMDMIPEYIRNRDDEDETWREGLDPRIQKILGNTYGIICFQESLTQMWCELGKFSTVQAEESRKIISKKWLDKLPKVQERWIRGASDRLGEKEAKDWWDKMQTFGRYAFNQCLSGDTKIVDPVSNEQTTIQDLYDNSRDFKLLSYLDNEVVVDDVVCVHNNGEMELFEVEFDNGIVIKCTLNHKFMCVDGQYHTLEDIIDNDLELLECSIDV